MEPQAAFYTSPLVVLDFQSLYPSVMIAYNYCYSTFLGRIQPFQGRYKFGVTDHAASGTLLEKLKDHINGTKSQACRASLLIFSGPKWNDVREAASQKRVAGQNADRNTGYSCHG